MDKKDGGQAFPHGDPTNGGDIGMTLRDYFAAQVIASASRLPVSDSFEYCARVAYEQADAMLAERAKDQP